MLYVENCVEKALKLAGRSLQYVLTGTYYEAFKKAKDALRGYIEAPLVGIQGPPGSGKTMVVEKLAEEYIIKLFGSMERELVIYVAPTNELTFSACVRVLAKIFSQLAAGGGECEALRAVRDGVRVLGYKIKSSRILPQWLRERCGEIDLGDMVSLTIDENVRLVFTTEFQRPYFKELRGEVKIIVDESSKSPYFRAFIPIVRKLAAVKFQDFPVALVALGDPQQAISVESYGRDILLMNVVQDVLMRQNLHDNYIMLDVTFRLPDPSHEPISFGYYDGRLRAYFSARDRIKIDFDGARVKRLLNRYIPVDSTVQKVVDAIEEAVNGRVPYVWFDVPRFVEGDTYDPSRAKLASIATLALYLGWENAEIGVNSIYTDVVQSVRYTLRDKLGEVAAGITSATVQSMIGDERDIIVAVLGKEYSTEEYGTLYYREPELLNVQLSRHRSLLVAVGCLGCLTKFTVRRRGYIDYRIANTGDKILELKKVSNVIYRDFS